MIRSFRNRDTQRFYEGERVAAFEGIDADRAARRLTLLEGAEALGDLVGLPSNRLGALRGARDGRLSIGINARWRMCFEWTAGRPSDVEIVTTAPREA